MCLAVSASNPSHTDKYMDATKDEVIRIFGKWLEERTRLKLFLEGPLLKIAGIGWLANVSSDRVTFSLGLDSRNDALDVTLSLGAVRIFEFVDPAEADPSVRQEAVEAISEIIALTFSASTGCLIFAMR